MATLLSKTTKFKWFKEMICCCKPAQQVLNTNKGEWFANHDEGITFSNILGKNKTEDAIKYELLQGLQQVDETFTITLFELTQIDGRKYKVKVTAQNSTGSEISLETTYG